MGYVIPITALGTWSTLHALRCTLRPVASWSTLHALRSTLPPAASWSTLHAPRSTLRPVALALSLILGAAVGFHFLAGSDHRGSARAKATLSLIAVNHGVATLLLVNHSPWPIEFRVCPPQISLGDSWPASSGFIGRPGRVRRDGTNIFTITLPDTTQRKRVRVAYQRALSSWKSLKMRLYEFRQWIPFRFDIGGEEEQIAFADIVLD